MCGIRPWEFENMTPTEAALIVAGRRGLDQQLALLLSAFVNANKKPHTRTVSWEDFAVFKYKKKEQSPEVLAEKLKVLTLKLGGKVVNKKKVKHDGV